MVGDGKKFLVGTNLTVADLYTYIVLSWTPYTGLDLATYPSIKAYFEGIKALPQVVAGHERIATKPRSTTF